MRGVLSENPDIRLPYWFSVTLIARSVFLLVGIIIVHFLAGFTQGLPTASGKAVTVMQFVVVGMMFIAPDLLAWFPDTMWMILYVLWGLTVLLGVISWLGYLRTGSKILTVGGHGG
jgi:phosphatidylglycerophosphate synthase